jgi:hypothetical protein
MAFTAPQFHNADVTDLASLMFEQLNILTKPVEKTEEAFNFGFFLQEHVRGEGEEHEVLYFKMRLYREWLEGKMVILALDIKQKQTDPVVRAKFMNNEHLMQTFLRRYWNNVVRILNAKVKKGLEETLRTHDTYLQNRANNKDRRWLSEHQKQYLKQWYDEHFTNPYPSQEEKLRIAYHLHMLPEQVTNWFNNWRNRPKKEYVVHKRNYEDTLFETVTTDMVVKDEYADQNLAHLLVPYQLDYNMWKQPEAAPTTNLPEVIEEFVLPDENFYTFFFL